MARAGAGTRQRTRLDTGDGGLTHIGMPTRFSDGTYGVYYCASSLQAAVAETSYHRAEFLAATREDSMELTMRVYVNRIVKPLHDIRQGFDALHDPDTSTYPQAQASGARFAPVTAGDCCTGACGQQVTNVPQYSVPKRSRCRFRGLICAMYGMARRRLLPMSWK